MPKRNSSESRSSPPTARTEVDLCDELIPTQKCRRQLRFICQAFEPLPDAVSITDPKENRLLYVNLAWEKLFRYTPAEVLGQQPRFLYLSDEPDQLIESIIEGTRNGGWAGRVLNQDKRKNVFPVQIRTRHLFDPHQKTIGFLYISTLERLPALGPEQIQIIIDAQIATLHRTLGQATDQTEPAGRDTQMGNAPNIKFLSTREREIFLLIGHGLTPTQIAERLHLSIHTVHAHRSNLRTKLDLNDSASLTYWAIHWVDQGSI